MIVFLLFLLPVFCLKRSEGGKRKEQEFSLSLPLINARLLSPLPFRIHDGNSERGHGWK